MKGCFVIFAAQIVIALSLGAVRLMCQPSPPAITACVSDVNALPDGVRPDRMQGHRALDCFTCGKNNPVAGLE